MVLNRMTITDEKIKPNIHITFFEGLFLQYVNLKHKDYKLRIFTLFHLSSLNMNNAVKWKPLFYYIRHNYCILVLFCKNELKQWL